MAEEGKNGEVGEKKEAVAPTEIKIPESVLAEIEKKAVEKAVAAANKEAAQSTKKIVNALTGNNEDDVNDRIMDRFVKDPFGTLSKVAEKAREEAKEDIREELKAKEEAEKEIAKKEKEKDAEQRREAADLWKKRPDINATAENRDLLNRYYMTTDAELPEKDRIAQAVKDYDAFMTKLDGKSSEDRIKAVADVSAGAGTTKEVKPPMTSQQARSELIAKQRELQAKKRGGQVSQISLRSVG